MSRKLVSRKLVLACCLFLGTAGAALAQTASSTSNSANPAPTGNAMSTDTMQPTHPDAMTPGHTQAMSHDNMSHDTMSHDNMSPGASHPSMAANSGTTQQ